MMSLVICGIHAGLCVFSQQSWLTVFAAALLVFAFEFCCAPMLMADTAVYLCLPAFACIVNSTAIEHLLSMLCRYDDDEGEVTQLCKQYNVRSVPKFVFFKDGQQLESFSTREKAKVAEAILKHAEPGSVEFGDWVTQK
jgi:hypothetical protein